MYIKNYWANQLTSNEMRLVLSSSEPVLDVGIPEMFVFLYRL